ncbi:MAG: ferrous iron transport protein B [Clostridia bacterium]|nr:ferrous iron transport protein B [Clostridia bacterium]
MTVALAGNPNVGKSSVFNALTGLRQHTGNWPGKTVVTAEGRCTYEGREIRFVDLPGTYSLTAHSPEEEVARDFLLFGGADVAVVVCDATCLERNLILVLQTLELRRNTVVCVNLMDEAARRGLRVDEEALSRRLGVPVVGVTARRRASLEPLLRAVAQAADALPAPVLPRYSPPVEKALSVLLPEAERLAGNDAPARHLALRLLAGDTHLLEELLARTGRGASPDERLTRACRSAGDALAAGGVAPGRAEDVMAACLTLTAEDIAAEAVERPCADPSARDRRIDRILAGPRTAVPVMLLLLALILWITLAGANYPCALLSELFAHGQEQLFAFFTRTGAPAWLRGALVLGVYRVTAWVVSVMLPPMAIFFPLFTLLEDFGYLPRVAFHLDHAFRRCRACGKQALTMMMGFGCSAVGVTGCRIIDAPRERLIAILTNALVPCNGRFPMLLTLGTLLLAGWGGSLGSALLLTALLLLGVGMTFVASYLLSRTFLKGETSSFTLELPPYRPPQIARVLVRSMLDRTLTVLVRAVSVAAPMGLLIWALGGVDVGGVSLLRHAADFLAPAARLIGLDGVILLAFLLGFPANEIVIPIALMVYLATDTLVDAADAATLGTVLAAQNWTVRTTFCTLLFALFHWPCATTCLTVWKETRSAKYTLLAVLLPTAIGCVLCAAANLVFLALGA